MTKPRHIKVAVVGLGVMGQHHVRVLRQLSDRFDLVSVYDSDTALAESTGVRAGVPASRSMEEAIDLADALFVATPTSTHHEVAMQAIAAHRHVFVEKPVAHTSRDAEALVHASRRARTRLAVGHTERFNPVVRWLLERLRGKEILSLNIERVGPRPPRIKDVGIVTDLGVHDLDLFECLTGSELERVRCVGRATSGSHEDIAQILVSTRTGVVGSININWLTPFKSRRIMVATKEAFFRADLLRASVEVCAALDPASSRYSVEDAIIRGPEPLQAQAVAFARYVGGEPDAGAVTGEEGLRVLQWVEHCLTSMREAT